MKIRIDPEFAHGYSCRAGMKLRQGNDKEAMADLETALKLARAAEDTQHQSYVESWIEELTESGVDNN